MEKDQKDRPLPEDLEKFWQERQRLNEVVMQEANLVMKRFFNLDMQAYQGAALSAKTKELLGLVASLVLRCDDCIRYHLVQCWKSGVSNSELVDALSVALVVGGSITIPHLRRALDDWQKLTRTNLRATSHH